MICGRGARTDAILDYISKYVFGRRKKTKFMLCYVRNKRKIKKLYGKVEQQKKRKENWEIRRNSWNGKWINWVFTFWENILNYKTCTTQYSRRQVKFFHFACPLFSKRNLMAARKTSRKMEWREWQAWHEENEVEIAKIQWISYAKGVWTAEGGRRYPWKCDVTIVGHTKLFMRGVGGEAAVKLVFQAEECKAILRGKLKS